MVTQVKSPSFGTTPDRRSLPMTSAIHKELMSEIDRVEAALVQASTRWRQERQADGEESGPPVDADRSILQTRWNSLTRAAAAAVIVEQDEQALIGSRVTFLRPTGAMETYHLVPPGMSHLPLKRIAVDSALGATLLGRRTNDEALFLAPAGEQRLTIIEVS